MSILVVIRLILIWFRRLLVTTWFWFWTAIATILLQVTVLVFGARDHNSITWLIENVMANFIYLAMTLPGIWRFDVYQISGLRDEDYDDDAGPFLLAANHNSIVDTLFMALLPHRKSYTFNLKWSWVPIFGPLCVRTGYVSIDTSNPEQKGKVVPAIIDKMKDNFSMMIYPQGSRSLEPDRPLAPSDLKHGTFTIAKNGGFKVLPIAIKGTQHAMMRGGWCDVARIKLIVCRPFEVDDVEHGKVMFCTAINNALRFKTKD